MTSASVTKVHYLNVRFKKELTLSTYQHVFFIIYGLFRINRIINDLVVFNVGPKLRNGPNNGL